MVVEEGREETVLSPENRVKFLCSNGGKILPRPVDGHLKYVGGETRVVVVPRDINFSGKFLLLFYSYALCVELMKKLTGLLDGDMVLKYQLVPEELDTLISVRCEEDLRHMLDEFYRQDAKSSEKTGTPRLRAFLFPSNPIIIETQMAALDTHSLLHRYIDAINGIVRSYSNISRPSLSLPSTSSSPKSNPPDGYTVEAIRHEAILQNGHQNTRLGGVHRVQRGVEGVSCGNFDGCVVHRSGGIVMADCIPQSSMKGMYG
ncbi:hypothetical protein HHK36_009196 [Tetracentron sinense]|uniref:PB1 domain-containing protein n=1 Tax=Tetracentron sinense TaxID=13715 RepID=A0A835DH99_TETSI|nr:hypothetical protein HHK36_009196 [Tetracentron sinense]